MSAFAASPVFLGSTTNYFTNAGTVLRLVLGGSNTWTATLLTGENTFQGNVGAGAVIGILASNQTALRLKPLAGTGSGGAAISNIFEIWGTNAVPTFAITPLNNNPGSGHGVDIKSPDGGQISLIDTNGTRQLFLGYDAAAGGFIFLQRVGLNAGNTSPLILFHNTSGSIQVSNTSATSTRFPELRMTSINSIGRGGWLTFYGSNAFNYGVGGFSNSFMIIKGGSPTAPTKTILLETNDIVTFPSNILSSASGLFGAGQTAQLIPAPTNNVPTTNILGVTHVGAGAVVEAAFNQTSELVITNRISAATTITLTNGDSRYYQMNITVIGEASGGAARNVTLVANTGQLIANLDIFGTALATSYTFSLTNGNAVAISDKILSLNGTNVHQIVTRQFAF